MRILALAHKFDPDDHILGFLYSWLTKIAKQIDELYIVSLENKPVELEKNIRTYSLGKEFGFNKIRLLYNFNKIISDILLKRKVDLVFVLMCPEYALLVSPYTKIMNVPVIMWYAHGSVNMRLQIASFLVNRVVSSSRDGFRIKNKKLIIVGQGIDIEKFKPQTFSFKSQNEKKIILSVGRISPIKNYETLIKAANILINYKNIKDIEFQIIGDVPFASQRDYFDFLKDMVKEFKLENYIKFIGPVTYRKIQNYYQNCDLFVSTSNAECLEKAVLEAMACGKITLTYNEAFNDLLKNYAHILLFDKNNLDDLTKKIIDILDMEAKDKNALASNLREIVIRDHNLNRFVDNILTVFKETIDNK